MRCDFCANFLNELDRCKFCHFEYEEFYTRDDWDIMNLDDDVEWGHIQILNRLRSKGIDCYSADVWWDDNVAYLVGCKANNQELAGVLGVDERCIYNDYEHMFIILNLHMEKAIRLGIDIDAEWKKMPMVKGDYYKETV